uniref:Uncharacterized protein n=1 Tax=Humisphaera borealis TaxID=2807512 RepID=A0A7M2WR13_9BACT|nr:hypothetical protein [Humisphaera borealis]QOV87592.1 hypothetical protein IPV69_14985 [Humisphaera borealis]
MTPTVAESPPTASSPGDELQNLCEAGSESLVQMRYLEAEAALSRAEEIAWNARDWDTLARLYMPLQETRRQRRQRCGEGMVKLDWISQESQDVIDADTVLQAQPAGQLLVAGWGTIEPALKLRSLAAERGLYVETFLAAVYPIVDSAIQPEHAAKVVLIVPTAQTPIPDATPRSPDDLSKLLPPGALLMNADALPSGQRPGDTGTYAEVMALWERLHRPFLTAADAEPDPVRRMAAYRQVIEIDYACELAHQRLSDAAKQLNRAV